METIGDDLRQMQRTPLAASHVEALRAAGKVVTYPAGTFSHGPASRSIALSISRRARSRWSIPTPTSAICPPRSARRSSWAKSRFLNGGAWSMAMRAVRDTRVIEVPREAMLTLMSQIPEMSDIIITVFSARRRRQLDERDSSLRLIGEDEDRNVRRIAEFASRNRIPYTSWRWEAPKRRRPPTVAPSRRRSRR